MGSWSSGLIRNISPFNNPGYMNQLDDIPATEITTTNITSFTSNTQTMTSYPIMYRYFNTIASKHSSIALNWKHIDYLGQSRICISSISNGTHAIRLAQPLTTRPSSPCPHSSTRPARPDRENHSSNRYIAHNTSRTRSSRCHSTDRRYRLVSCLAWMRGSRRRRGRRWLWSWRVGSS